MVDTLENSISLNEYNAMAEKFNKAQDELTEAQSELAKAQHEIKGLTNEKNSVASDLESLNITFKTIQDKNLELKENDEALRKRLMIKDAEIEEIKNSHPGIDVGEYEELKNKISDMEQELKNIMNEKEVLKSRNKDIKFQLQNSKYKVLDLEKKLIDAQIDLASEKERRKIHFLNRN